MVYKKGPSSPLAGGAEEHWKIFSPVMQIAYVVPDLQQAITHWNAMGIGPFHVFRHLKLKSVRYLSASTDADFSMAIGYMGDIQLELIEQHNDAPSIYKDYLDRFPVGGQQHLAVIADDYDRDLAFLEARGVVPVQEVVTMNDKRACYVNTDVIPGGMIEILEQDKTMMGLFDVIKKGCHEWDGVNGKVEY